MNLLALDTATEACSVTVARGNESYCRFATVGRTHTQTLFPMVDELMCEAGLAFSDLDALVCGVGPGSFAGVRIGVGYAKGVALPLGIPVLAFGSLTLLAQAAMDSGAEYVLASIDARMDEVYFAAFERDDNGLARGVGEPQVCLPGNIPVPTRITAAHGVGSGWGRYQKELCESSGCKMVFIDGQALPDVRYSLKAARAMIESGRADSPDLLTPAYVRQKVALTLEEQIKLRQSKSG